MIWEDCQGSQHIEPIKSTLFRVVESQEQIATLGYVDTLEEQALLEEMLENVKPPYPSHSDAYHYLLKTPFRYPPLTWGSRFGRTHEPSIFYGGKSLASSLAESAYYRFVFWYSMDAPPPKDKLRTEHSLFSVQYATPNGIRLQSEAFAAYSGVLKHPQDYLACQQLGSAMRVAGVLAFEYPSARDPEEGFCVGLFSLAAFKQKKPQDMSQWLCEVSATEVSFKQLASRDVHVFSIASFWVDGKLPLPA